MVIIIITIIIIIIIIVIIIIIIIIIINEYLFYTWCKKPCIKSPSPKAPPHTHCLARVCCGMVVASPRCLQPCAFFTHTHTHIASHSPRPPPAFNTHAMHYSTTLKNTNTDTKVDPSWVPLCHRDTEALHGSLSAGPDVTPLTLFCCSRASMT